MLQSKLYLLLFVAVVDINWNKKKKQMLFACSAINPEEKIGIKRTLLLESFAEPVPQIAIQMAVLIGNISRLDYPNDWEEVSHVTQL